MEDTNVQHRSKTVAITDIRAEDFFALIAQTPLRSFMGWVADGCRHPNLREFSVLNSVGLQRRPGNQGHRQRTGQFLPASPIFC